MQHPLGPKSNKAHQPLLKAVDEAGMCNIGCFKKQETVTECIVPSSFDKNRPLVSVVSCLVRKKKLPSSWYKSMSLYLKTALLPPLLFVFSSYLLFFKSILDFSMCSFYPCKYALSEVHLRTGALGYATQGLWYDSDLMNLSSLFFLCNICPCPWYLWLWCVEQNGDV